MSIARLSIDLEARLANLQAGLDKAGVLAAKQAEQIEKAFSGLKATAASVGVAFGAMIPTTLIAGFQQFFRSTVDGLDKLNDLADATGASVENLSALEDIAIRTGTSVDVMGDALVKMNKALADAKPGSDQAEAFKALGLSVAELKRLDPVEAFQRLAIALSGYANDGNKARLVQELFGKSLREVAPLLKDAAEAGKLNATVTKEQAEQAEKYNKSVFALQKNLTDLARTVTGPLIKALNDLHDAQQRNGFWSGLAEMTKLDQVPAGIEKLAAAYRMVSLGIDRITPLDILKKDPGNARALAQLAAIDAKARELAKSIPALDTAAAKSAFLRGDKDTSPVALPSVRDITKGKPGKPEWNVNDWMAGVQKTMDMAFIDVFARLRDAEEKDLQKRRDQLTAWTEDMRDENLRLTVQLVDDEKARAKALILLDQQVQIKRLESLGIYGQAYEDALAAIRERTDLALRGADKVKDASKDVAAEIGLVFSSAAGEAITKFDGLRGVLKGVLADLEQIAVRETITKPLGNLLTDALKGFSLTSLFASAKGNAFGPGGVIPFAMGGVVNQPTLFKFGGGTGLMGEAGPEAILPLKRGRGGKLGVAGGGMSLTVVNNIDSRTDAAVVAQSVASGVQAGQQQMLQYLRAQGVV